MTTFSEPNNSTVARLTPFSVSGTPHSVAGATHGPAVDRRQIPTNS